jgi:hypothetical protein
MDSEFVVGRFGAERSRNTVDRQSVTLDLFQSGIVTTGLPRNNLAGIKKLSDIISEVVTPECFNRGSREGFRLDSRLKHAGMTRIHSDLNFPQRAAVI